MSRENVEVVRRWIWAFENDTEEFRAALHPQIEWYPIEEDNTPNLGIDAAMRNRNEWLDTWDSHRIDWEVVAEEGENVVALVHITAQGKASGVQTDVRFYAHFKVRDGKVAYIYDHGDRTDALEAVGLRE